MPGLTLSLAVELPGVPAFDPVGFLVPDGISLVEVAGNCFDDAVEVAGFGNVVVVAGFVTGFTAGPLGSLATTGALFAGTLAAVTVVFDGGLLFLV